MKERICVYDDRTVVKFHDPQTASFVDTIDGTGFNIWNGNRFFVIEVPTAFIANIEKAIKDYHFMKNLPNTIRSFDKTARENDA